MLLHYDEGLCIGPEGPYDEWLDDLSIDVHACPLFW